MLLFLYLGCWYCYRRTTPLFHGKSRYLGCMIFKKKNSDNALFPYLKSNLLHNFIILPVYYNVYKHYIIKFKDPLPCSKH